METVHRLGDATTAAARVGSRVGLVAAVRAPAARGGLLVVGLSAATYLMLGYQYANWPSTALLDFVERASGRLQGDWQTDQPAPHWAITQLLALAPRAALEEALIALWALGLVVLWTGFVVACRRLGASWLATTAAGVIAIPTGFGGLGVTESLFGYVYPPGTSFALGVAALAAALSGRSLVTGLLAGAAVAAHPSAGVLAAIVVGAVVLAVAENARAAGFRFAAAAALPALVGLLPVLAAQGNPSSLSAEQRFELLAIVRQPHHVLYSEFPAYEYARTILWTAVLAAALAAIRSRRPARGVAAGAGVAILGTLAGGVASEAGGPVIVLQAQLARLTPFLVMLAIVASAAAATMALGRWAGAALGLVAIAAPVLANEVSARASGERLIDVSGAEAALVFMLLVATLVASIRSGGIPPAWRTVARAIGLSTIVVVVAAAAWRFDYRAQTLTGISRGWIKEAAGVALVALGASAVFARFARTSRHVATAVPAGLATAILAVIALTVFRSGDFREASRVSAEEHDWRSVAAAAQQASEPGELVLTPPERSGFRYLSDRPVVVEFGSFRYDAEDAEWMRRMMVVTGSPLSVDPSLGPDVAARTEIIAAGYRRTVERTPGPICAFGARLIVVDSEATLPRWLSLVYRNRHFALYRPRPGICEEDGV